MMAKEDSSSSYLLAGSHDNLQEQARLDLQHELWLVLMKGSLTGCEIPQSARAILDVGTGTGIWAVQMAQQRPSAHVWATDFVIPAIASRPDIPKNLTFLVADAEQPWDFSGASEQPPAQGFDYIHARLLTFGMHDWDAFFARSFQYLRPGGVLEICDTGLGPQWLDQGEPPVPTALDEFFGRAQEGAIARGIDRRDQGYHGPRMERAGFDRITLREVPVSFGTWDGQSMVARQAGALMAQSMSAALPALVPTSVMHTRDMDQAKAEALCAAAIQEMSSLRQGLLW